MMLTVFSFSFLAFNVDTVGNLAFLLKAGNFHERVLQWGLVGKIYHKVRTHCVIYNFLLICV